MSCPVCCEKMNTQVKCECDFTCCRTCIRTYLAGQVSEPHCMNCKLAWNMDFLEGAIGKTYLKTDFKKQRAAVFVEFEKTQLPDMQEDARIYEITESLNQELNVLKRQNKDLTGGTTGCNWCIGNKFKLFLGCDSCKHAKDKDMIRMENIRLLNLTQDSDKIVEYIRRMETQRYNSYYHSHCNYYRFKCSHCSNRFPYGLLYKLLTNTINDSTLTCECCNKVTCIKCFDDHTENHECSVPFCICNQYECDNCLKSVNEHKMQNIRQQISIVNNKELVSKERKTFVMKCQVNECKGFLSQAYKCGLCSKFTCSHCYMPKEENHECNPDNVASTKMIKEETRPCPKCSTRIYKIDGCDQMWCTDCRTAFSWKTGAIVNGNIHNPHYYEYLRNTQGSVPRADQPYNPCGEVMDNYQLRVFRQKFTPYIKNIKICHWIENHVQSIHRYLGELNEVYESVQTDVNDIQGDQFVRQLKHNRILFLLDRIDKSKFEHDAFMYHQRSVQYRRFLELIQMLRQVVLDLFNNMYTKLEEELQKKKSINPQVLIDEIHETYKQLFGVIDYFKKQHTINPYTKIHTDHFHTMFKTSTTDNGVVTTFFVVPEKMDDRDLTRIYELTFSYISEKDKKENNTVKKATTEDYDSDDF